MIDSRGGNLTRYKWESTGQVEEHREPNCDIALVKIRTQELKLSPSRVVVAHLVWLPAGGSVTAMLLAAKSIPRSSPVDHTSTGSQHQQWEQTDNRALSYSQVLITHTEYFQVGYGLKHSGCQVNPATAKFLNSYQCKDLPWLALDLHRNSVRHSGGFWG